MNYYDEIKNKLIDNEIYEKVKDYSKERNRVLTYFEVGRLLNEAGTIYGQDIIGKYADKLVIDVGKKYNKSTLFKMKKLYLIIENKKMAPLVPQLTWSHYLLLIPLKDKEKIYYYINQTIKRSLSKRELTNIIQSNEYERLPDSTKNKLIQKEEIKVEDFVKNPIVINNKNNYVIESEKVLQRLILEDIESFMKELGNSFSFIGSEYKIKIGNTYNYIDLLLFNIDFNCYVVIELKITELQKEHIGQIEIYMNYIDNNLRKYNQDKTIGIIITRKNNKFIMEYCSDKRIMFKEYSVVS